MNKQPSGLRFESREIAVILSLFIMVSLLMFTVGIVVGKGLAQAKFEGNVQVAESETHERSPSSAETHLEMPHKPALGTSVSANPPIAHPAPPVQPSHPVETAHASPEHASQGHPAPAEASMKLDTEEGEHFKPSEPLELKPKKSASLDVHNDLESELESPETLKLLKNPKLKDLFESEKQPTPKKVIAKRNKGSDEVIEGDFTGLQNSRAVASVKDKMPRSFAAGPYSVQVAAYSDESQAKERVEALKTLGFPHAYFSAINLGENKETWFRVWLGYYPSFESAKQGGESLQARGEVKNFLVRKSESTRP
ncbi:MAG: SPOR domain-containing protein [Proteobacteria bacterium]|nr:SPOR domain-containing protein [Pseudomonadota bacterium]